MAGNKEDQVVAITTERLPKLKFERKKAIFHLVIANIIFGFIGVVTFIPLLMSVMAFDAPGSTKSIFVWIIFLCLFLFAPMCFISIFLSWLFFQFEHYRTSRILSMLPLLNIIIFLVTYALVFVYQGIVGLFSALI